MTSQAKSTRPALKGKQDLSAIKEILKETCTDPSTIDGIRVENCIGFSRVPVGIAGPLTIHGEHQKATVYAPLATVEPTLVASCSRGCKALMLSGGVHAAVLSETMSRAPVFSFRDVGDAVAFYKLVPSFEADFRRIAEQTSRYARLKSITPSIVGASVHIKFQYTCGDAVGQNMVTIATHNACLKFLESPAGQATKAVDFLIDGNRSSDKKASWDSVMQGRGVEVLAWARLSNDACKAVLGSESIRIHRAFDLLEQGGIRNGQFGSNINTSNIMAAMFIACGQDAASVFESGWTHLTTDYDAETKDIILSSYMPNLLVGSVGGGTAYATQQESLKLLGCAGNGGKYKLAETIVAFALALDISLVSALANDTFANAHLRLARL